MKILHVGDIHLGCTLDNFRRNQEIVAVFQHLAAVVREKRLEAALLAGDIFDSGTPSNESQTIYFRFLADLQRAGCRQVIVIAGNHDNPNFLDASRVVLERMDIHVIGNVVPDDLAREVIPLGDPDAPAGFVCAVPYLRQRDVRELVPEGETGEEELAAVSRGIEEHYRKVFAIAEKMRNGRDLPIIGMGHLYARGSSFGVPDAQAPAGTLDPVDLERCASGFAYMALGHLHRPQCVAHRDNWRYAGAILPMDVRVDPVEPQVVIFDTDDPAHLELHKLPQSCFHRMCVVQGDMSELRRQIGELCAGGVPVWIKPLYTGDEVLPNWAIELKQEFRDQPGALVLPEVRRGRILRGEEECQTHSAALAEVTPEEVFLAYLDQHAELADAAQREMLLSLFRSSLLKVCDPAQQPEKSGCAVRSGVMRFKRLFIRNVNSLYGENIIDFTAPEFSSGIFLISGNTGAGKSSILDAVTLALYGRTPRVDSITASRDSVMSEGTGEMLAELTFSLGEAEYRASFRHKRTLRAQLPFMQPQHRLFRNGEEIPPAPRAGIAPEIQRLIGMNAEQFSRCVLLAQGSFDAFLKAKAGDRSEILKSITGTEIYTKIGMQINQDYSALKSEYAAASAALEGIRFLSGEELKNMQELCLKSRRDLELNEAALKECEKFETLFQNIEESRKNLQTALANAAAFQQAQLAAGAKRKILDDANRALNCQAPYAQYQEKLAESARLKKTLGELFQLNAELEKKKLAAQSAHDILRNSLAELLQKERAEAEIFQQVRTLDMQLAEQKRHYSAAAAELEKARIEKKSAEESFAAAQKRWHLCQRRSAAAREYLQAHGEDRQLAGKVESWELRRAALAQEERANAAEKSAVDNLDAAVRKNGAALEILRRQHQQNIKTLEALEQAADDAKRRVQELLGGKTLQELRLAWAAACRLSDFFKETSLRRQYLSPDQPCPLCGSTRHPYCEGVPIPDKDDFNRTALHLKAQLDAVDDCEKELLAAEKKKSGQTLLVSEEKVKVESAGAQQRNDEEAVSFRRGNLENAQRKTAEAAAALAGEYRQLLQIEWHDLSALPPELFQRIEKLTEAQKVLESFSAAEREYEAAEKVFSAVSGRNDDAVKSRESLVAAAAATLAESRRRRMELFGEKAVDVEENKLNAAVAQCRSRCDLAAVENVRAEETLAHNGSDRRKTEERLRQIRFEIEVAEKALSAALGEYRFSSVGEYLAAWRDVPYIQSLNNELLKLDENVRTALAASAERQKFLDELCARLPSGLEREGNSGKCVELQRERAALQGKLSEAEIALRSDQEARLRHQSAQENLHRLGLKLNQWKILDNLFGSTSSSDRFGRIAQGYTFRELLHYANGNRLQALRNHFTLVSDADDPLELNVIDHYRGDQVRTSRNLSGGESFEVSLALALGLAEMSAMSQKASLGNVLLDEGFGTLDDKALESALELLTQLKGSGRKLVGIISHVAKLKERIPVQIEVAGSCGMGILSGAGVVSQKEIRRFLQEHPECGAARRRGETQS